MDIWKLLQRIEALQERPGGFVSLSQIGDNVSAPDVQAAVDEMAGHGCLELCRSADGRAGVSLSELGLRSLNSSRGYITRAGHAIH